LNEPQKQKTRRHLESAYIRHIVYVQTETLNFTFIQKAVFHIYIFVWLLSLWQHNVITSPVASCNSLPKHRKRSYIFVHFSSTPLRSWTWLYRQKANKM